ncbi:hypothetical protein CPB84DRAFT_1894928 [Gymnopilus junonius]|uniref:Uncharacterized protein n=1 Tax=Gymnopilus junonius TaxID=109634 RepID=A0A9P5TQB2_GYMJU|nr:hypothetical protein CPB84DRAFT_1894928 [Gymnopilus junonius]
MAFPTSLSAFGMKPATTGTSSVFGSNQPQQQPSGSSTSAFGQNQQQNTNAFSAFGQNQQQTQQQPGGSLFGQPQQQQQQPTGSLFGQPQQQQPTGSLFGQPQQQQPTGSLFGQPQQQQQQQPVGSLFGQAQQQQPQQQTNVFGGGSLFGTNTSTQQPQQSGLFGSATTNPLQPQATLPAGAFGSINTGGAFGNLGGSTLFGSKSQQPQQQQLGGFAQPTGPSQTLGPPPFIKSTKFNDLPDEVKKVLENIDTFIQGRVQICKDLQQRKLGDEPMKSREAIRQLNKELINTATTIRNDLHMTKDLKEKVDQAVEDTIVATRIIDGFRNPQSGNTYLKDHATFPLEYFTRVTDQMKERLAWYKSTIEQIERKLASASGSMQTPQNIAATLQAQHSTFLALASRTAAVDAELQKIKALYTQLWRSKTGSVRDPFDDIAKSSETVNDFGLSGLSVR